MQGKASNAPPLSSKSRISIENRDHRPGTRLALVVVFVMAVLVVVVEIVGVIVIAVVSKRNQPNF